MTEFKLIDAEENGKKISPVLPSHVKNFLVDIDGTVGEDIPNEEPERMEDAEDQSNQAGVQQGDGGVSRDARAVAGGGAGEHGGGFGPGTADDDAGGGVV